MPRFWQKSKVNQIMEIQSKKSKPRGRVILKLALSVMPALSSGEYETQALALNGARPRLRQTPEEIRYNGSDSFLHILTPQTLFVVSKRLSLEIILMINSNKKHQN